ncbi:NPS2 protein, partial [Fructobacillus tropaeoli]
ATGEWAECSLNDVSDLTKAMALSYTLGKPLSILFLRLYLRALSAQNNLLPLVGGRK